MEVLETFPLAAYTQVEIPITPEVGGFPILLSAHTLGCFQCALHYAQNKLPCNLSSSLPPLQVTCGWTAALGQVGSGKEPG